MGTRGMVHLAKSNCLIYLLSEAVMGKLNFILRILTNGYRKWLSDL